ncbi:hypothetical protein Tco_1021426 [Tanacetum coccineum]
MLLVKQDRIRDRAEIQRLRAQIESAEVSVTLAAMNRDRIERELYWIRGWLSRLQLEITKRDAIEVRATESIDVLAVYGDSQPSGSKGPLDAAAITEYELNRANAGGNAGGNAEGNAGGNARGNTRGNVGGNVAPKVCGCTYKTFLGCNPLTFSGTEGAIGLSRWIKKIESIFQISKCANEDKVKYGACTLQGRALTWWNGDDIDGYTNRFHELAALCPSMVTPEYKKIESLMDYTVRFKGARSGEANKRKWEDHHSGGNNNSNNHNNTHHH